MKSTACVCVSAAYSMWTVSQGSTLCCLHYVNMASRCYAGTSVGIADVPWHPFIIVNAFSDFSCWQNTVCVTCKMSVLQAFMKSKHPNMDFLEHYSIMKWKDISEVLNIHRKTLFCGPWGCPSLAFSARVSVCSQLNIWLVIFLKPTVPAVYPRAGCFTPPAEIILNVY